MKYGYDVFGKAYGVMLRNDLHSVDSIDHDFLKTMILLDDESCGDLYKLPCCAINMSQHELYTFSQQFKRETERATIDAVLQYTSKIAHDYDVPFEEMRFGGTEKQIIERGTDWCADMARVCCVLLKCLNIPCRILHLADTNKAYNGHVVCEAFYEKKYGVIDPIYGFRFYQEKPISGYELLQNHHAYSLGYDGYMNLYGAIAVNEYDPLDCKNDYSISKPNEYYLKLIRTDHHNQWFMGEDAGTDWSAVHSTRRAADHGDRDGQYHLACFHAEGVGVERDMEQAIFWYRKAALQKHDLAIKKCRELGVDLNAPLIDRETIRESLQCRIYPLGYLERYKYTVICTAYQGKWILARHKKRNTWETQGGHIEAGETPLECAKRELFEESGIKDADIYPVCDYWGFNAQACSNGMVFLAVVHSLGALPESEMQEIKLFDTLPVDLTYPHTSPKLYTEAEKFLKEQHPMEHTMKLRPSPFQKIKCGEKTIELRLYDEKRRVIQANDIITFTNTENANDVIRARVVALHVFDSFETLYAQLPLLKCGYTTADVNSAKASDMNAYYSPEEQKAHGVVGIEISLL